MPGKIKLLEITLSIPNLNVPFVKKHSADINNKNVIANDKRLYFETRVARF